MAAGRGIANLTVTIAVLALSSAGCGKAAQVGDDVARQRPEPNIGAPHEPAPGPRMPGGNVGDDLAGQEQRAAAELDKAAARSASPDRWKTLLCKANELGGDIADGMHDQRVQNLITGYQNVGVTIGQDEAEEAVRSLESFYDQFSQVAPKIIQAFCG